MNVWLIGLGFFLIGLLGGAPLSAASFSLTPGETREALRVGQRSVVSKEFGKEWQVVNENGDSLRVMTPFHRLALGARNAAFKNETLTEREIEKILRAKEGRLLFWANLHGGRTEFARWYRPMLLLPNNEEIKPAFVQNERTALPLENGRYLARCLYSFPTERLRAKSRVVLVVREPDGREAARFTLDFSTMR
ncbi:MAG: hypothetical protein ACE5JN_03625 [Candidatus Methylomirabilia bacterium]